MRKKLYISIFILIVLVAATLVAIFAFQPTPTEANTAKSGLKAGDTFTYSLTGISELGDPNATTPENFLEVNQTDTYKLTITAVDDPIVSFNTQWRFKNGTQLESSGQVNVETGISQEFWAIYVANLTVGQPVRPAIQNGAAVNVTETRSYIDGDRTINVLQMQGQFYDSSDPTHSRSYLAYTNVHFDKQTGMLVELRDRKIYSEPAIILTVEWKLVDSNVWAIA
jgi:hypothetical protein